MNDYDLEGRMLSRLSRQAALPDKSWLSALLPEDMRTDRTNSFCLDLLSVGVESGEFGLASDGILDRMRNLIGEPATTFLANQLRPFRSFGQVDLPLTIQQSPKPLASVVKSPTASSGCLKKDAVRNAVGIVAHKREDVSGNNFVHGTALHLGNRWVLTAHHVVPHVELTRSLRLHLFNGSDETRQLPISYSAEAYFSSADGPYSTGGRTDVYVMDYAIIRIDAACAELPQCRLVLAKSKVSEGQHVQLVRPVRPTYSESGRLVDIGKITSKPGYGIDCPDEIQGVLDDGTLVHSLSDLPGDSGGAITNDDGEVVGIHTHTCSQFFPATDLRHKYNWGTSIHAIASDIKVRAPHIFSDCPAFRDLDFL